MTSKKLFGLCVGVLLASSAGAQGGALPKGATDADKLEASAEHLARMKTALKQVLGRVEEARSEKDIVKLNCANEKLAQVKALLKVAEQADIALHEAIANRDPTADTEFSKVAIARTKVEGLRADADQCIGQLAYIVDEKTTVEVQQPANLPGAAEGSSLGITHRGEDPAGTITVIGAGDETAEADRGRGRGRGPPFVPPPIVRPPPASPHQ